MNRLAVKAVTGVGAFGACYIPWPWPPVLAGGRWFPDAHLRWLPVAVWACAWVLADGIRDAIEDDDPDWDIADTSSDDEDEFVYEGDE